MTTTAPQPGEARRATVFLAVAMAVFALLDVAIYLNVQRTGGPLGPAAGLVLSLVVDACLLALCRFPRAVAVIAIIATVVAAVGDTLVPGTFTPVNPATPVTAPLCTPVIVWFLAHTLPRREVLAYVAVLAVAATRPWVPSWETAYAGSTTVVLPAVLGLYVRARRELVGSLRQRAESAEREQHLLAERATAAERQRLAGEMHDIVTHHVTEMVLAAGALKVSTTDRAAQAAAEQIRSTGSRALAELRDLIGILRHGHEHSHEYGHEDKRGEPPHVMLAPADVCALVEAAVSAGNPTSLYVTGEPKAVTPAVARGAYRVLQEALTNAMKHAHGARVDVELTYDHGAVTVTVTNAPPPRSSDTFLAASGSGTGLDGLRRRVLLLGGSFEASPALCGGFRVSAALPASVPTDEAPSTSNGGRPDD
ncbi:sensor histidine kinase [Nonomuraea rubra]|uniref:histidine kinase n=1 Tax=Nonomuraea rubra TaxID=46180 RepID=A0A7X0NX93_9ACTN|nr:histidine kinase [Nonomuraea rubra]MBB6551257.1 signal transduction histidine kinase [Nonomuraea rubra]